MKGTGFNRLRKNSGPGRKDVPQGLKPTYSQSFTARLKSCPDTKTEFFPQPVKARSVDEPKRSGLCPPRESMRRTETQPVETSETELAPTGVCTLVYRDRLRKQAKEESANSSVKQIHWFRVNSREHTLEVDPNTPLLFVLNDELGITRGRGLVADWRQCGSLHSDPARPGRALLRNARKRSRSG